MSRLISSPRDEVPPETRAEGGPLALAKTVLHMALQPIVDMASGGLIGFEALMRGHDQLGHASPHAFLDTMHRAGTLREAERHVSRLAMRAFAEASGGADLQLFLNLDGRSLSHPAVFVGDLMDDLAAHGIAPTRVNLELSERTNHADSPHFAALLSEIRRAGPRVALDDFGTGHSELKLLCDFGIETLKIDRHFIQGLQDNSRKRRFVHTVTELAHVLGIRVIAEGIETEAEYLACRDRGCDAAQGYFIARPASDWAHRRFDRAPLAALMDRRPGPRASDVDLVRNAMARLPTIREDAALEFVFDLFRTHPKETCFPVVTLANEPIGVIHERDIKRFIYADFGRDLLRNPSYRRSLQSFVTRVPIAEIDVDAERMVELFANAFDSEALILTEGRKCVGLLSPMSMLRIVNDKKLKIARDRNPLIELPGNLAVHDFVLASLRSGGQTRVFCYLDFDHFKPFNDALGFQVGDRAILTMAHLLKRAFQPPDAMIGHIGGDDFFVGVIGQPAVDVVSRLEAVASEFSAQVAALYPPADREVGSIVGKTRGGKTRRFPLMRSSIAVVLVDAVETSIDPGMIGAALASGKTIAKRSRRGFHISALARRGA